MAFPNLTIVIPHGGAARLRNLRAVVARLVEAEVEHALITEMDPLVRELARAAGCGHVFVEQETTFHKTRAMNAAIPLLRTPTFLWLDFDILITSAFLSEAIDEINTRQLDCFVPRTTVRYLNASDSAEVAAWRRDPRSTQTVGFHIGGENVCKLHKTPYKSSQESLRFLPM